MIVAFAALEFRHGLKNDNREAPVVPRDPYQQYQQWHKRGRDGDNPFPVNCLFFGMTVPRYFLLLIMAVDCLFNVIMMEMDVYRRGECSVCCDPREERVWAGDRKGKAFRRIRVGDAM